MLRSDQDIIDLMRFVVSKFSKPGDSVLDTSGATFATENTIIILLKHQNCICRVSDSECLEAALPSVIHSFVLEVSHQESDVSCLRPATTKTKAFNHGMARMNHKTAVT